MLSTNSGLGWVGLLVKHFLPVNALEEGVRHNFKSSFRTCSQTTGGVTVQKAHHKVFGLLRYTSRELKRTIDDVVKELFFVS